MPTPVGAFYRNAIKIEPALEPGRSLREIEFWDIAKRN